MHYIVMQRGYEYNDEIYSSNDEDSGKPLSVFKTRKTADEVAFSKNINFLRKEELGDYFYSARDFFKDIERAESLLGDEPEYWDISKLTDQQVEDLVLCLREPPFYVVEVQ